MTTTKPVGESVTKNNSRSILSERLEYLRKRNNWTKTDVQRRLNLPTLSTYASYEYGGRVPRKETLLKIANLYGVSVDFLLGNDSDETIKDMQFLESFANENVRRWAVENLSEINDENFNKLKHMWDLINN